MGKYNQQKSGKFFCIRSREMHVVNGDSIRQTFEGFINQTLYATELDLSREVVDDLDWAARVYGIKRSQVADSILRAAFREYKSIITGHEQQLAREET